MPTGETMEEGDYSGASADTPETVTISAALLGGVPVKAGDKLRFCATSDPDEDGNVEGYFEASETEPEPEVEEAEAPEVDWKEELKTKMTEADEEGI